MGTIRTATPPDSLGNHLTELKHKLLMEAKTRTILRPTIRRTTLHTLMRGTPQSSAASASRSLPLLTTAKSITITPLIKSTPTMREHMPLNSGSTKTKSRPKTHSALLLPARISTINPRIMGITDRKVLSQQHVVQQHVSTSFTTARWYREPTPEERLRLGLSRHATQAEVEAARRAYEDAMQQADRYGPAPQ